MTFLFQTCFDAFHEVFRAFLPFFGDRFGASDGFKMAVISLVGASEDIAIGPRDERARPIHIKTSPVAQP